VLCNGLVALDFDCGRQGSADNQGVFPADATLRPGDGCIRNASNLDSPAHEYAQQPTADATAGRAMRSKSEAEPVSVEHTPMKRKPTAQGKQKLAAASRKRPSDRRDRWSGK
jgi:hypothetical protein